MNCVKMQNQKFKQTEIGKMVEDEIEIDNEIKRTKI
jgi:hypothetical protein